MYYQTHNPTSLSLDHVLTLAIKDAVLRDIDDKQVELGWKLRLAQLVEFTPRRSWLGYGAHPMYAYHGQEDASGKWTSTNHPNYINFPGETILGGEVGNGWDPNGPQFAAMKTPAPTPDDAIAHTWAIPISPQTLTNTGYKVGKDIDPGTWNGGMPYPSFDDATDQHIEADDAEVGECWSMPYYSFLTCFWDPQVSRFAFNLFGRVPRRVKDVAVPTNNGGHWTMNYALGKGVQGQKIVGMLDTYWGGSYSWKPSINSDTAWGSSAELGNGLMDYGYWHTNHVPGPTPTGPNPNVSGGASDLMNYGERSYGSAGPGYGNPYTPLHHAASGITPAGGYDAFALLSLTVLPSGRTFTDTAGNTRNTKERSMNGLIGFSDTDASEVKFEDTQAITDAIKAINQHGKSADANTLADGFVHSRIPLAGCGLLNGEGFNMYSWPRNLGYIKATGTDVKSKLTFKIYYRSDQGGGQFNPHVQDVDIPRLYAPNAPAHVSNGSGTTAKPVNQAYVHCHLTEGCSYTSASYTPTERFVVPANVIGMVRSDMTGNLSVPYGSTRPMTLTMGELSSIRMSLRDNSGALIDNSSDWTVTLSFCFFLPSPYQGLLPQYAQGLIGSAQQQHSPVVEEIMQAQQLRNQVLQAQQNALINQQKAQQKPKKKPKKVSKNKNKKKKERKRRKKAAKKQQQQQQPPQQPPPQNAGLLLPVYAGEDIH